MNSITSRHVFVTGILLALSLLDLRAQSTHKFKLTTSRGEIIKQASVMLIQSSDSMLVEAHIADNEGFFALTSPLIGSFILIVSHPDYLEYTTTLSDINSGEISTEIQLTDKANMLEEVVVIGNRQVLVNGDTLEYNPAGFTVRGNSNVEDLLRQLPDFTIDNRGTISISGRKINKLLVDGEEFFGDDPVLATRNLKGFMIDKIQVYNLNETATAFGDPDKIVNLKIKEEYKFGYFGKLSSALGKGAQQQQAMFSLFRDKLKFSTFASLSTTDQVGLSWNDTDRFASTAKNPELSFLNSLIATKSEEISALSDEGQLDGVGLPRSFYTGLHFSNVSKAGREKINFTYNFSRIDRVGEQYTSIRNALADQEQISVEAAKFEDSKYLHGYVGNYQLQLDSTLLMKVIVDGLNQNNNSLNEMTKSVSSNDESVAELDRLYSNQGSNYQLRISNIWEKKGNKNTLYTLSLSYFKDSGRQDGFLTYNFGLDTLNNLEADDQQIKARSSATFYNGKIQAQRKINNFTGKLSYDFTLAKSLNELTSMSTLITATELDSLNSGSFLSLQYVGKLRADGQLSIGKRHTLTSGLSFMHFKQYLDETFEKEARLNNWAYLFGNAGWNYQFSKRGYTAVSYQLTPQFPSGFEQQRIAFNLDPLNRLSGNWNIQPSISQRFSITTNVFKERNLESFNFSLQHRTISNPVIQNVQSEEAGVLFTSYSNSPRDNYLTAGDASYSRRTNIFGMSMGLASSYTATKFFTRVDDELLAVKNTKFSIRYSLDKYADSYNFYFRFSPAIENFRPANAIVSKNNGFTSSYGFNIYLPGNFSISSDGSYRFQGKNAFIADDFRRTLLNASLSKTFFKAENLMLSLAVKDLLNQNVGIDRFADANKFVESRYTTLGRYLLCSITWDFNQVRAKTP